LALKKAEKETKETIESLPDQQTITFNKSLENNLKN